MKNCRVLDVTFDNIRMEEALDRAEVLLEGEKASYVVTPNTEIVWRSREDPRLLEAIRGASLVLPDGIGVVYGAGILGCPIQERVPGIDFMYQILKRTQGKKVFLLGAKPGVAEKAAERLKTEMPGLTVCGTENGYFTEDAPIVEKVNASGADILFVCLGFPKQEYWMHDHASQLNVKLMAGLGGSLDVFAGLARRAPKGWQKLGLEWLYRLLEDPKRIKRMIVLPKFMFTVIWERLSGKNRKRG